MAGVDCALICLDLSPDGSALLAVGRTAKQKPLLVVWDISQAHPGELPVTADTALGTATGQNVHSARHNKQGSLYGRAGTVLGGCHAAVWPVHYQHCSANASQ